MLRLFIEDVQESRMMRRSKVDVSIWCKNCKMRRGANSLSAKTFSTHTSSTITLMTETHDQGPLNLRVATWTKNLGHGPQVCVRNDEAGSRRRAKIFIWHRAGGKSRSKFNIYCWVGVFFVRCSLCGGKHNNNNNSLIFIWVIKYSGSGCSFASLGRPDWEFLPQLVRSFVAVTLRCLPSVKSVAQGCRAFFVC